MPSSDQVLERPLRNTILRSLSPAERSRIQPDLEYAHMTSRFLLQDAGESIEYAYFVESGTASIVIPFDTGAEIEAGTIGFEGIVNGSCLFADNPPTTRTLGQIEGQVIRIASRRLRYHAENIPALLNACMRHSQLLFALAAQSAACNVQHELSQRLARWMLFLSDQTGTNSFALTQETIAELLGVRRPTVSVAAMSLQLRGLIRYRRGRISIVDREGLKQAACECYAALAFLLAGAQIPLVANES